MAALEVSSGPDPPAVVITIWRCFLVTGALIFVSLAVPWLAFLITLTLRVAFDQQPAASLGNFET